MTAPPASRTCSAVYETVAVLVSDRPGEPARIFADAGRARVTRRPRRRG
ncbi:hypothetical protein [Streptomyces filamentosus]